MTSLRRVSAVAAFSFTLAAGGCGGPSAARLSATEKDSVVAEMRSIQVPAGFQSGALVCIHGYACWTAPQAAGLFSDASYQDLAQRFGVTLTAEHCDPPKTQSTGLTLEDCTGHGRWGRYELGSELVATRNSFGQGHTEIGFAPVRRVRS